MDATLSEADRPAGLLHSTVKVTTGNLASRITGLLRVIAIAAALGATFLGNTYQSANLVSNLLFELLLAGVLSSVLVPPFVELLDRGRRDEAEEIAGGFLGLGLVVLGVICVVGLLARTWIMQALTVAVPDPAVRAAEIRLGSFLLILFVPQVLLYAVGTVSTALLHGARRFSAVAFAPVANNVIVIATMGVFWAISGGRGGVVGGAAGLDLSTAEKLVLAIGTTAGVAAMSLVPLVAVWRSGIHLRPRWDPRHPRIRALARAGGWGAAYLALSQVLIATTLVLANQVEGGVVAYQVAFTLFLLPHALLAQPLITVLYPRLAAEALGRTWHRFADTLAKGGRWVIFLTAPAAAFLLAAASPALDLMRFGHLDASGTALVARVAGGYALGIVGYAGFLLVTRASYAAGDTRTPALVNLGVALGGSGLMLGLFAATSGDDKVVALGFAYSAAVTAGALVLLGLLQRRTGERVQLGASVARAAVGASAAGGLARLVVDVLPSSTRADSAVAVLAAAAAAGGVYLLSQWVMGAPELAVGGRLLREAVASSVQKRRSTAHFRTLAGDRPPVVAIVAAKDQAAAVGDTVTALRGLGAVDRVVVVDDGSTDSTRAAAAAAGADVVGLVDNVGKGGAVAAGLRAAPDAGVYLLVDADVGESARAAAALLAPVLAGEADMTVGVLPPAGPSGGLGKVRALSAAGIELATGRRVRAPLSGQRAVTGDLLRDLLLAPRFGLEVALTIDAIRNGARVVEVPVTMGHREWGRGARGCAHRAHQGVDVVQALWPRLTSARLRVGAIVLAFTIAVGAVAWTGSEWEPASIPGPRATTKVLVIGVPGLSLADVDVGRTPNLNALARHGAIGAMSVRTVSADPSALEAYASLGAGGRVEAPGELIAGPGEGGAIRVANAAAFRAANRGNHLATFPGALGDAVHASGRRTAAVGAPEAAAAVMDGAGAVDAGELGASDTALLARQARAALAAADVVIVGTSGAEPADVVVGHLVADMPAGTQLLVAGITPDGTDWRLTPLVAGGAGTLGGYLQSPTTKRLGLVTLADVAPTVLGDLGLSVPRGVSGHTLRYHLGNPDISRLVRLDDDAAYRERIYFPIAIAFIVFQAVTYGATLLVLRRRGGPGSRWGSLVKAVALLIAAFPLATFLLRAVPQVSGLGSVGGGLALCAVDLVIVALALRARHHFLSPLSWVLAATVGVLVADLATGGRLQLASVMGYSPQSAGRFFGIGNTAFAVLAASSILAAALHLHHAPRRQEALVTVALFLALVAVVDGAPSLGGDVGGIVTLVPVFGLMVAVAAGLRFTWRAVAVAAGGTLVVLAVAAGIDLLREPDARTHLGRLVADTWTNGDSGLLTTLARRAQANLRALQASVWTWAVPIIAAFMLCLLAGRRRAAELLPLGSPLRIGVVSALACGLLGFAVNDSGVVVTALVLTFVGPFLSLVALFKARSEATLMEPAGAIAPSSAVSAPAGAPS